jgi:hypothetical protein
MELEWYWKKSLWSQVGKTTKFIEARNLVNNKRKNGKVEKKNTERQFSKRVQ